MTMYKVIHPSADIERLNVSKKKGGRGLASIMDYVDVTIWGLDE